MSDAGERLISLLVPKGTRTCRRGARAGRDAAHEVMFAHTLSQQQRWRLPAQKSLPRGRGSHRARRGGGQVYRRGRRTRHVRALVGAFTHGQGALLWPCCCSGLSTAAGTGEGFRGNGRFRFKPGTGDDASRQTVGLARSLTFRNAVSHSSGLTVAAGALRLTRGDMVVPGGAWPAQTEQTDVFIATRSTEPRASARLHQERPVSWILWRRVGACPRPPAG